MKKEEKIIKCLKELNTKLKYQNELVETRLYCSQLKEKRLQERINKAIDYIEKKWYSKNTKNIDELYSLGNWKLELLDILKGEDKE